LDATSSIFLIATWHAMSLPRQVPHHRRAMDEKYSMLAFLCLDGNHMANFEAPVD